MRNILMVLVVLTIVLCTNKSFAQKETLDSTACETDSTLFLNLTFKKLIPGDFVFLNVDMFNNIYTITTNKSLQKRSANGDSLYEYNNVTKFGVPSIVDVNNPLKALVFYKTYSTIVVLNKQLNFRNSINFRNKNIYSFKAITASSDNNIWLFDQQDFKLKLFDEELNLLQESTDMRMLVDQAPIPTQIINIDNLVFLYDEKQGFFIFDKYAGYKNNLPFRNWKNVGVSNNVIYGFCNNHLYTYELNTLELKKYKLPDCIRDYKMVKITDGKLYLLNNEGVAIYAIK